MKINSIELSWFRGAATSVILKTDSKSAVIYGENACGKSSFVDAVEFIINKGKIAHLRNEFSEVTNCIRNTETPQSEESKIKIIFENKKKLEAIVASTGKIKFTSSSDTLLSAIQNWESYRHILRQDEVSGFIRHTKSEKYSVLSPLLGLEKYEEIAKNMKKIKDKIIQESKYELLKGRLKEIQSELDEIIPKSKKTKIYDYVISRSTKYTSVEPQQELNAVVKTALTKIEKLLDDKEPIAKRYLIMKKLDQISITEKFDNVIKSQDDFAKISDIFIDNKIPILENSRKILESIEHLDQEIECPACGQNIIGTNFMEHVTNELEELNKARNLRNQVIKEKNEFIVALSNFISQYKNEKSFLDWLSSNENGKIKEQFLNLEKITLPDSTANWSSNLLHEIKTIFDEITPFIKNNATIEVPATKTLIDDLNFFRICQKIPKYEQLKDSIEKIDVLLSTFDKSSDRIRKEIESITEKVLETISKDIARIWGLIHPGQKIENVRLSSSDKSKAIEVCLKFYGKEQVDPRLTLSEGYRNSLGLSIFLALANQQSSKENPILLDDIVSSLDREHRGMVSDLLNTELADRQVLLFTHDREWFSELRSILDSRKWKFFSLKKWKSPKIGIELLPSTYTFDEAETLISTHIPSCGNAVRAIMDTELPKAASKLRLEMPFIQGHHNDNRMAAEFLDCFMSHGENFQVKDGSNWKMNQDAIDCWKEAKSHLIGWANRASHGGSLTDPEARKLIEICKKALSFFKCNQCKTKIWKLEANDHVQCKCGSIRWKF